MEGINVNMKTIFFTICDTKLQVSPNGRNLDFKGFMNSFKRFHPDVQMIVFNETDLLLAGVDYYSAKAALGLKLKRENPDCNIVNVDSDHYFFDRMDEILTADYDIACPENYNITGNLVNIRTISGHVSNESSVKFIDEHEFLQGGLIASPSLHFWEHYEYCTRKHYMKFGCYENDTLNIVAYTYPYKVKTLDRSNETTYYGCSILGLEHKCYVEEGKLMCNNIQVKAYHFAHGHDKKTYKEVFPAHTHDFIKSIIS